MVDRYVGIHAIAAEVRRKGAPGDARADDAGLRSRSRSADEGITRGPADRHAPRWYANEIVEVAIDGRRSICRRRTLGVVQVEVESSIDPASPEEDAVILR